MFVDDQVIKEFDGEQGYDKFSLASILMDVSFNGASCSLLESKVLENCEKCGRSYLCRKLEELVEDYTQKTTVVKSTFRFDE